MEILIRILDSSHTEELEQVRQFFRNYAAWLGWISAFRISMGGDGIAAGAYSARRAGGCFGGAGWKACGMRRYTRVFKRCARDEAALCRTVDAHSHGIGRKLALSAIGAARDKLQAHPARHPAGDAHRGQAIP